MRTEPLLDPEFRPDSAARTLRRGVGLFLACGALSTFRPLLAGWDLGHCAAWFAVLTAFVWLPGSACTAWFAPHLDALSRFFLSCVTGLAVLALVFVPLCALDARHGVWALPVCALAVRLAAGRRTKPALGTSIPRLDLIALALPLALVIWRVQVESPANWFRGFDTDLSFHVGNAAELRWRWPLGDPRIAGEPLRYHFLSYVPAAVASVVTGFPVRECASGLGASALPLLFALGLFAAARALGAGAWMAALLTTVLVMHADLGTLVEPLLKAGFAFTSPFDAGLYASVTTAQGLCAGLAIVLVLHDLFRDASPDSPARVPPDESAGFRATWPRVVWLALLAFLASGSKSSVMPPILLAMLAVWIWRRWRAQPIARVYVPAFAALLLGTLPFCAWLSLDAGGYAQSMFTWTFSAAQVASPFQATIVRAFGGDPSAPSAWMTCALFPVWCAGFLGASGLALVLWARTRTRPLTEIESILCATFLAGFAAAVTLSAPGASQLFFAYGGLVALILLAAVAAGRLAQQRAAGELGVSNRIPSRDVRAWIAAGSLCVVLQLSAHLRLEAHAPRHEREMSGDVDAYRASLEWIRASTPPDAVLLIEEPRLAADQWAERRTFSGTTRFLPRHHRKFGLTNEQVSANGDDPIADRKQLKAAFFADPRPETLRSIRDAVGSETPLYVLRTNVELKRGVARLCITWRDLECPSSFGREAGLELVHASATTAVYRVADGTDG